MVETHTHDEQYVHYSTLSATSLGRASFMYGKYAKCELDEQLDISQRAMFLFLTPVRSDSVTSLQSRALNL